MEGSLNTEYLQYGTNNNPFRLRKSASDRWFTNHLACSRIPNSFFKECLNAAKTISLKSSSTTLLISGGLDSEVMARSFILAGASCTAAIMAFKNGLNQHDVDLALNTVKELNLSYRIYELDLFEFIHSKEAAHYAQNLWVRVPWVLPHMWLLNKIDGFPVMGCGDCYLEKDADGHWHLIEREQFATWFYFLRLIKKPGVSHFFSLTAEQRLSFLLDPEIQNLCLNKKSYQTNSTYTKYTVYANHFAVNFRPKLHGFENIRLETHDDLTARLQTLHPDLYANEKAYGSIFKIRYQEAIEALKPRVAYDEKN